MSIESEPADGLGWGFGSFLFQGAFTELSKGLRWMFWGLVLLVIGWTSLLAGFGLALHGLVGIPLRIMILGGGITMLAGSLGLIWGEQRCLHLELPLGMTHALPGRRWLRGAYWCHMGGILARLFRQWGGRGLSMITLPLNVLGFIFLLLFLRKVVRTIARDDLRRLIDTIFALAAGSAVSAALIPLDIALHLGMFRVVGRLGAITLLALPVLLFVAMIAAYASLLWQMGTATRDFARFLAATDDPPNTVDNESNEGLAGAPEGA